MPRTATPRTQEQKHSDFLRLATVRTRSALTDIRKLEALTARSYFANRSEWDKVQGAISGALAALDTAIDTQMERQAGTPQAEPEREPEFSL